MNTGYVVRLSRVFDPESVEKTGQQSVDGSWDWLSKPIERSSVLIDTDGEDAYDTPYVTGGCTWQNELEEDEVIVTDDDRIKTRPERQTVRKAADWLVLPEEKLGVVSDTAAIGYLEDSLPPGVDVKDPEVNVSTLARSLDLNAWGVGFDGRYPGEDGDGARKGAVYGDRVQNDPDIGEDLERLPLSQAGFEHTFGHESLKAYVSESAYVAAHGEEWMTRDFIPWVVEVVAPHLRDADDEEEDDKQTTLGGTECDECGDTVQNTEPHGDEELCLSCHDDRVKETEEAVADGGATDGE